MRVHCTVESVLHCSVPVSNHSLNKSFKMIGNYYPTVLVIVQKARETSTNIPRYCTVGCCTVPCARPYRVTLVVFFQVTEKG